MSDPTTEEQILDAADAALRRYGAHKFTVTDVARQLEMSHSNVYRFFKSKNAIYEALTRRWLCKAEDVLAAIADGPGTATQKLTAYILDLHHIKRQKVLADAESFATYAVIVEQCEAVVGEHLETLRHILRRIIVQGDVEGDFDLHGESVDDTVATIEHVTMRFRVPSLVQRYIDDDTVGQLYRVVAMILRSIERKADR